MGGAMSITQLPSFLLAREPRMKQVLSAVLSLPLIALAGSGHCQELAMRKQISDDSKTAFLNKNFALLESTAARFREERSRTPSGLWKLTFFYVGIQAAMSAPQDDERAWAALNAKAAEWEAAFPRSPVAPIARSIGFVRHGRS